MRTQLLVSALLLSVALPALASQGPAPAGLSAIKVDGITEAYLKPGTDLTRYGKLVIDPIKVDVTRQARAPQLDATDISHAQTYFTEKLTEALGAKASAQGGAGALRLKITLTDYQPNRQMQARTAAGGTINRVVAVGRAGFTAELVDESSGQTVAVYRDIDEGAPLGANTNINTQYGDADQIMRTWARQLSQQVGAKAG
jgi:hypothetical protein